MIIPAINKAMLDKGMSQSTVKTYSACISHFLRSHNSTVVGESDVAKHIKFLVEIGLSANSIRVHVSALKFLLRFL